MKKERFFELMNDTDDALIDRAEKYSPPYVNLRAHRIIRWTAVAATLCVIIAACIAVPLAMRSNHKLPVEDPIISNTDETTDDGTTESIETDDPKKENNDTDPGGDSEDEWVDLPATDGLVYIISPEKDAYYVSDYIGTATDIVIPDTYNGLPVTKILDRKYFVPLYDSFLIISGVDSPSVPQIPEDAPDWVKNDKQAVFCENENITSLQIGHNVESIDLCAFENCISLQTVKIGKGVTNIHTSAFKGCEKLEKVQFSNGLTFIGFAAFQNCTELKEIKLPGSVTTIGSNAFLNCKKLESVNFSNGLKSIGDHAFENCIEIKEINLPNSIESIRDKAFSGCTNLSEISVSDNVIEIGYHAFETTAYFYDESNWDNDMLYVGDNLIWADDKQSEVIIREGTKSIASRTFYDHVNIRSVKCPESLILIGEHAFARCYYMESFEISEGVQTVGKEAFLGCMSLKEISLPDSIVELGEGVFRSCEGLKSIKLPKGITTLQSTFGECTALENIVLPDNLTFLTRDMFKDTAYYNDSSNWEDGMLYIGKYLLEIGQDVKGHVVIKDGTECIAASVSTRNDNILSITLPSSLKTIARMAFSGCYSLFEIYNLSSLDIENMDNGENGNIMNYAKNVYKSLDVPTKFKQQGEYLVYCDEEKGEYILVKYLGNGSELVLPSSIDGHSYDIRPYAFSSNSSITKVTVPEGVDVIGDYAFEMCENLTEVIINGSSTISSGAFFECLNLSKVVISNSVKVIGGNAFHYCNNLQSVVIGNGVELIDEFAFGHVETVYYCGTSEQWNRITISEHWGGNSDILAATIYFYSETEPTTSGNYWHYVDGVPTVWTVE